MSFMMLFRFALVLLAVGGLVVSLSMGPLKLMVLRVDKCPMRPNGIEFLDLKMNNTPPGILSIKISTIYPFDDNLHVTLTASKKDHGEWRPTSFNEDIGGYCTAMKRFMPKFFEKLLNSSNYKKCPSKAGNYTITDFPLDIDFQISYGPYGRYRVDVTLGKTRMDKYGCLRLFVNSVPST